MNNFKKFLFNGLLLTSVSLILRGVGVSFNAYISNKIGAEAMGLFSLISTVYGFAITLATSGINLAATRLVSEALGKVKDEGVAFDSHKNQTVKAVMSKCFAYCLFFSLIASLLLFFGAPFIGVTFLRDKRTVLSLRVLAFTLLPLSLSSALSGYFTAVRRVYKNALTQICEQFIKIAVCVILLTRFLAQNVESACVYVIIGTTVAEILSFILQAVLYSAEKALKNNGPDVPDGKLIKHKLFGIALPVAFSAYLRSALISVEHALIPFGLERSGNSRKQSLSAYGTVQSMVFPIVLFPAAVLSSFASLLIPEVARANTSRGKDKITRIADSVFESSLLFSIGTAGIMMFFSYELGNTIYPATEAGFYIRMVAPLIPVMYLDTAVDALLKGLGEQVYSMAVNIADSFLSVILVIILIPRFGIVGYIITVYFTEILNATLSITRLLNVTSLKPRIFKNVFIPLASVILSSVTVSKLSKHIDFDIGSSTFELIFNISLTAAAYVALLFAFGIIKKSKKSKKVLAISHNV